MQLNSNHERSKGASEILMAASKRSKVTVVGAGMVGGTVAQMLDTSIHHLDHHARFLREKRARLGKPL